MEAAGARSAGTRAPRPRRWEIWEFDLDPAKGREQRGLRACLVISTDALNQSDFGTVVVCPMTTTYRQHFTWRPGLVPEHLWVATSAWEPKPSWVATDQIATIDVRLGARRQLATLVAPDRRRAIADSIRMILALEHHD